MGYPGQFQEAFTGALAHADPGAGPVWSAAEWAQIRRGHRSRDTDDRWQAFTEGTRLFLHRRWTGLGVYEAEFTEADGAWRITEAVVAGDPGEVPPGV